MKLLRSPEERFVADRLVLLHFKDMTQSIEGYVVKETRSHYWLQRGKLLETKDRVFDLEGTLLIPKRNVFFPQVLAEATG